MASASKYETQHVSTVPPGYHVRTVKAGTHEIRVAFPPGSRKKGSGKVVEVLHPRGENPGCAARSNPLELVVMGANPMRRGNPLDSFTRDEKLALGRLGIKWKSIRTEADANRARRALKEIGEVKQRYNPIATEEAPADIQMPESVAVGGEPDALAKEIYGGFHDVDANRAVVTNEPHIPRGSYAQIGVLYALHVKPAEGAPDRIVKVLFANRQPIRVISDISRRQIFFAQGGQREFAEPRLRVFGCGAENLCELGEVRAIIYLAVKHHAQLDDGARGRTVEYIHKFGEKSGIRPTLFYNRQMQRLLLQGGDYTVLDEGIEN